MALCRRVYLKFPARTTSQLLRKSYRRMLRLVSSHLDRDSWRSGKSMPAKMTPVEASIQISCLKFSSAPSITRPNVQLLSRCQPPNAMNNSSRVVSQLRSTSQLNTARKPGLWRCQFARFHVTMNRAMASPPPILRKQGINGTGKLKFHTTELGNF
jgi:hypothetical protein